MNFSWVYPEDSGEYVCRASNLYGMDETRGILKTTGKPGIIYESQLPKGMASIERIRELESGWQRAPELIENEAERFKNEDEAQRDRIQSKNNLESYCFNMKATLDDARFKDKVTK